MCPKKNQDASKRRNVDAEWHLQIGKTNQEENNMKKEKEQSSSEEQKAANENLLIRLNQNYGKLSKGQKRLADFITAHYALKWISSEVQLSFTVECTWKSRHWAPLNLIVSFGVPSFPEVFITSPLFRMRELNIHSSNSFEGNPAMLTCICPPMVFPAACPHGPRT